MRLLGIDYGSKRVGLALSDDSALMAFPFKTLINNKSLVEEINNICNEEQIGLIVIGESRNYEGKPNEIMKEVEIFINDLKETTKLEVKLEPEYLTSVEAERIQGKNKLNDSSAACIILNSFLNKQKNDNN